MEGYPLERHIELMIDREQEWVVIQPIPRSSIIYAYIYRYDEPTGRYIRDGEGTDNPHYVEEDTIGNRARDDNFNLTGLTTATVATSDYINVATASFCPNTSSSSRTVADYYGIKGSCFNPLALNIDNWSEELKTYKKYIN